MRKNSASTGASTPASTMWVCPSSVRYEPFGAASAMRRAASRIHAGLASPATDSRGTDSAASRSPGTRLSPIAASSYARVGAMASIPGQAWDMRTPAIISGGVPTRARNSSTASPRRPWPSSSASRSVYSARCFPATSSTANGVS